MRGMQWIQNRVPAELDSSEQGLTDVEARQCPKRR